MHVLADMTREIGGLRARHQKVEIQTGSLDGLTNAINRAVGYSPDKKTAGVTELSFMGVPVIENDHLLPSTAVIISNGEIINILNFD